MNFKIHFADKKNEWYTESFFTGTNNEVIDFVLNKLSLKGKKKSREHYRAWVYNNKGQRVYAAFVDNETKEIERYDNFNKPI